MNYNEFLGINMNSEELQRITKTSYELLSIPNNYLEFKGILKNSYELLGIIKNYMNSKELQRIPKHYSPLLRITRSS